MTLGKFLYKYQAFDDRGLENHGLENLTKHQIWFSKPIHLNDPYDCAILPPIRPSSEQELFMIYLRARNYFERLGEVALAGFEREYTFDLRPNTQFKDLIISSCEVLFAQRRDKVNCVMGVACFSEENNDLLMWSHYGRAHTGFCIEFDTSCQPFGKQFKVEYSQDIPSVNPVDMFLDRECPGRAMLATKADCWAYEKEWRLLNTRGDTALKLAPGCVVGIYFGLRTDQEQKTRVMATLQGMPVKFYDMVKSETMFKLETQPVSIPH